jgi:hypothetical protein
MNCGELFSFTSIIVSVFEKNSLKNGVFWFTSEYTTVKRAKDSNRDTVSSGLFQGQNRSQERHKRVAF